MFKKVGQIFTGDPHKKKIEKLVTIVDQINALEAQFEKLSDEELGAKTVEYRGRLAKGETLDALLPEAFATVREASKRVLGQRHYDVQLICGINLHQGGISELRTGEGKTLSATLPLYLNALEGKGAHLVTVNDYLARRDGRWMGGIFDMLGMSVGVLQAVGSADGGEHAFIFDPNERSLAEATNLLRPVPRKQAYLADITYGTNSEFGFDYLRDNITMRWDQRVQRGHHFAIIDEVDNILIDEARTPLIISGASHEDSENYIRMAQIVRALNPEDYEVEEKDQTVSLTEVGIGHVEELLGEPLSDPERPEDIKPEQARLMGFLEQSLRAAFLFRRNKDYIVQNGEVIIVDEFTGRMMPGRRWSDGLHQAIEAKEGVKVQAENITHATITIQNYFRMYSKLAGMTGTALTEKEEFFRIYGLDVLSIPTNLEYQAMRPESGLRDEEAKDEEGYKFTYYYAASDPQKKPLFYKRKDYPDVIYRTTEGKMRAIVQEIIHYHVIGRPQLVGSTSVENSERLSERLSSEMVRRLLQVKLIRQAWFKTKGLNEADFVDQPELKILSEPLDKLRMPELRRLATQNGVTTLDLADESNKANLLALLKLEEKDWERLKALFDSGIPHQVLNARKHTEESLIIAGAGAFGAVTIATNMAGRGVDIKLGGELSEGLLSQVNQVLAEKTQADPYNMSMPERLEAVKALDGDLDETQQEAVNGFLVYMQNMAKVRELGGLHVIGSERHEARRIDNQLRGRAGRQGDPGSSRFYLALDDDLMRMFGGQQMEGLLQRFKIDENMPIEIPLVNRLVEQSQTRVEGANFDVRKHLLEYDDVLNTQRNRIYSQRDKIFTKDDLHEDVNEMLITELSRRIRTGLEDKEGPWKLLGFLEDIQPSIQTDFGSYPSYSLKMVLDYLGTPSDEDTLIEKLVALAKDAVLSENDHIREGAALLFERSEQSMKNQLAERTEMLDAYLDSFDPSEQHDLAVEIGAIVQTPVRLSPAQQRSFMEDPMSMKAPLKEALRTGVMLTTIRRILLTLEKRFGDNWAMKPIDLAQLPWAEVRQKIDSQINDALEKRMDRLFGAEGEVRRDLEANPELLQAALTSEDARAQLVQVTTEGKRIAFDARSHRKTFQTQLRLNYLFSMSEQLLKQPAEKVTEEVLTHLQGAEKKLAEIFGEFEFQHLADNNFTLADLPKATKDALNAKLGEQEFGAISGLAIEDVPEALHESIREVLGDKAQNRIYRDLLLGTISETWVEYLTRMEALRVSISMESYAQRDPLVRYKSQASTLFTEMLSEVRQTVISRMFRYRPTKAAEPQNAIATPVPVKASGAAEPKPAVESSSNKKRRKRH
jgi:preprotein translocase subunit SecA